MEATSFRIGETLCGGGFRMWGLWSLAGNSYFFGLWVTGSAVPVGRWKREQSGVPPLDARAAGVGVGVDCVAPAAGLSSAAGAREGRVAQRAAARRGAHSAR